MGTRRKKPLQLNWQDHAACTGQKADFIFAQFARDSDAPQSMLDLFYTKSTSAHYKKRVEVLKELCGGCKVQKECLDHSISIKEPNGLWGGLTEIERKQLLKTGNKVE